MLTLCACGLLQLGIQSGQDTHLFTHTRIIPRLKSHDLCNQRTTLRIKGAYGSPILTRKCIAQAGLKRLK
ncbi:MAG: hypothetical protein BCV62_12675 [Pseudomonas sp. K35]|nr:MAG: hypothetical protein BCV62_12675 [Pseudomonas sp. K35]